MVATVTSAPDRSARRLLGPLLCTATSAPVRHAWDLVRGAPQIRITLVDRWPLAGFRALLCWRAPAWLLELECAALEGASPTAALDWSHPGLHDVTLGWTRATDEHRFTDVDGLTAWVLAAAEAPTLRFVSSLGHVFDVIGGSGGGARSIVAPTGRLDARYDDAGRLEAVVIGEGEMRRELARLTRDDRGLVRRLTRPGRVAIELEYDGEGRPAALGRSDGERLSYSYPGEHEGRVAWAQVRSTVFGDWDILSTASGLITATDARTFRSWKIMLDGEGRVLDEVTPDGLRTHIDRDPVNGAPIHLLRGSLERHFYYDQDGFLVLTDGSLGPSLELRFDGAGRLTSAEGTRALLRRVYSLAGQLVSMTGGDGTTKLEWNEHGQLLRMRDGMVTRDVEHAALGITGCAIDGARWRARRDPLGRIEELSGPEGEQLWFRTSENGDLSQWGSADGFARSYAWSGGVLAAYRDESDEIRFARDSEGRLTGVPQFDLEVRRASGVVVAVEGSGVREERSGSPELGRATTRDLSRNASQLHTFDPLGRLAERRGTGLSPIALDWAAAGLAKLRALELADESPTDPRRAAAFGEPIVRELEWTFERDELGRIVVALHQSSETRLRRVNGRPIEDVTDGERVASTRDDHGFRASLSTGRGLEVEYERDSRGRIVRLSARMDDRALDVSFAYDRNGREISRRFSTELELQFLRDSLGRVLRRRVVRLSRVLYDTHYGYRGARLEREENGLPLSSWTFRYDRAGVLVASREGSNDWLEHGGEPFRGHVVADVTYDEGGRPLARGTVHYEHDLAGRRTRRSCVPGDTTRYTYDALGCLARVTERARQITHHYDPLGRRRHTRAVALPEERRGEPDEEGESVRAPAAREGFLDYVWDGPRLVHRGGDLAEPVTYLDADGMLVAQLVGGEWAIALPDPRGAPAGLLAGDGRFLWSRPAQAYLGATDEGIVRWAVPAIEGHYLDPVTRLYYSHYGDFDPETGRYLVPSPFGVASGPWRYGLAADPIGALAHDRGPVEPFAELAQPTFDAVWARIREASLACDRDEIGRCAWRTLAADMVPDPERILLDDLP